MDAPIRAKRISAGVGALFSLAFFVALSGAARCHNFRDIFISGKIYLVDADCYSRMTRVRMVLEHPATIIRHHDFENFPQGTVPHTTMPMDWLVAIADCGLRIAERLVPEPLRAQHLDLAGALVSPLLGVITTAFLWFWSRRIRVPYAGAMLMIASVSPILVQGTLLGRPDHQSLLIFLLAVATGAEVVLARETSRGWGIASGAAWGLALWVSLYEPLILLATVCVTQLVFLRAKSLARGRWPGFAVFGAILVVAFAVEGWRVQMPDATMREFFSKWTKTIGELQPVPIFSATLFRWCGFVLVAAPVLLALRVRVAREVILLLALMAVAFGFTLNQLRWGYFFALVFAMSLPFALAAVRKKWIAWTLFAVSLWPVAGEWEAMLFPNETRAAQLAERRADNVQLRDAADRLAHVPRGGVLAPWWFSPALAYWSGQPCVAGSSHESLAGIVDTARFYLTAGDAEDRGRALELLNRRQVRWVVSYDWARVLEQSEKLLPMMLPRISMARRLDERPHNAPPFLRPIYANGAFKIFEVERNVER